MHVALQPVVLAAPWDERHGQPGQQEGQKKSGFSSEHISSS
ncbi:hypothetical protein DVDV_0298 [Desulfovibrio sp. DV]|nr:hypothetical protein DVDV_0298 [Desulfovibrio sp. DV]